MHESKLTKKFNLPRYHLKFIRYPYSIKRALIYILLIQHMLSAHLRKFRIVASHNGQSFLEKRWRGRLLLLYSTFANEPILISRSAGTKLISLVFAHDFPHLWESPASSATSDVSFLSLHAGAGVTGRLYHNAVFVKPLTLLGVRPPVAPLVLLWPCVSHRWLQWYPCDHVWATSGFNSTSMTMREPPVVTVVFLWSYVSHWYLYDYAWATGGSNGTSMTVREPSVAPVLPYDHAWATGGSNDTSMTMREPLVATKVASLIDLLHFMKPLCLS
jgi:hypothetical protein